MPPICGDLQKAGFCVRQGCSSKHPNVCDVCEGIRLISGDPQQHYLSDVHLRFSFEKGVANPGECSICTGVTLSNAYNFISHYRAQPHRNRAQARGVSPCATLSPVALRRCHPCNRLIQNHCWSSHIRGESHCQKTEKRKIPDPQASGTNATGSVQPDNVDLGFVSPNAPAVVFRVQVQLPKNRDSAHTTGVSLSSTAQSAFKVNSYPTTLSNAAAGHVAVSFSPSGLAGRIQCKLTLALQSSGSAGLSSIVKDLLVTVGRQSVVESMAAVAPYTPAKQKQKQRSWKNTLRGERIPLGRRIVFTVELLPYEIPNTFREALWRKSLGEQEDAIHKVIPDGLDERSFSTFWGTLLHAEELQIAENIAAFNMPECTLRKDGSLFKLDVPGLAENRPSVLLGDKIALFPSNSEGERFIGYVHQVREMCVLIHLHGNFDGNRKYDVEFCPSRSTSRRMHQAIQLEHPRNHLIFPTTSLADQHQGGLRHFAPFDPRISDNAPQRKAISAILGLQQMSPPYIVFGPPGTGKTVVVVEAIRQILSVPGLRILATAPSNSAADVIAERLAHFGVTPDIMFRLNALTRRHDLQPPSLSAFSCVEERRFDAPPIDQLLQYRIIVSTCISSSLLFATGVPRGHFDYVFIDEAGYALEPEALVPVLTIAGSNTRVILSGDPKQLGPITHSACVSSFNFGKSFLERLMGLDVYSRTRENPPITKLVQNYRSHPSILDFPNKKFYDGELVAMAENDIANRFIHWDKLWGTNFPIIFHAVHGQDEREANSPSYFNRLEIDQVGIYLDTLLGDPALGVGPDDIGVIAPYRAQNKKIRALETVKQHAERLKIGTVEAFQAQERPVIVMSTVRSSPDRIDFDIRHSLGFVAHPKRLNVAITRARSLLIIIGDPKVLSLDQVWNEFLHYVRKMGGWRGVDFELPELDDDDDTAGLTSTNLHQNMPSYDYELPIRESD